MRFLVVLLKPIRDDNLYGAEQSAIDVAEALARQGVEVNMLQWNPSPLPVKSKRIHLLRVKFSGATGLMKLTSSVVHAIRESKPDVVYGYADCFEETFIPSFLGALLTRKKFLLCVPDDALREIDERPLPEVFANWHASGHSFRSSLRYTFYHAMRRLGVRTTAVSLVSARSVETYARGLLKARRVFLIPLGLDPLWLGRTSDLRKYDAIYVGGLWGYKNVDVLIDAWSRVVKVRPGAKLLILGEGGARPQLEKLASDLGLSELTVFSHYVATSADVHNLLSESRVFAFASVWEGWGRVVTEAMATGLPCVLSDIPVFRELYSETAVLVPPGRSDLFAQAILGLLADPVKYDELAGRGTRLMAGLTWDVVAKRMKWVVLNT